MKLIPTIIIVIVGSTVTALLDGVGFGPHFKGFLFGFALCHIAYL